jgi:hypothetical protein
MCFLLGEGEGEAGGVGCVVFCISMGIFKKLSNIGQPIFFSEK